MVSRCAKLFMAKTILTKHFTLEEFSFSSTAKSRGINNTVPLQFIPSLRNLCEKVLEPLREQVKEPVIISSGYRCPALNRAVGGSNTSQHMKGEACDIHIEDKEKLRKWFAILMDGDFDQLIFERNRKTGRCWIHVSCKADSEQNRH